MFMIKRENVTNIMVNEVANKKTHRYLVLFFNTEYYWDINICMNFCSNIRERDLEYLDNDIPNESLCYLNEDRTPICNEKMDNVTPDYPLSNIKVRKHPYHYKYLEDFASKLGEITYLALLVKYMDPYDFIETFKDLKINDRLRNGYIDDYLNISSKDFLSKYFNLKVTDVEVSSINMNTKEYFLGYLLAYIQFEDNFSFKDIFDLLTIEELYDYFDNDLFIDKEYTVKKVTRLATLADEAYHSTETNLQKLLNIKNLTVEEVSDLTKISKHKVAFLAYSHFYDLKRSGNMLKKIAKVLDCNLEDLLNYNPYKSY